MTQPRRSLLTTVVGVVALVAAARTCEPKPVAEHRVVFDISSDDPKAWETLFAHIESLPLTLGSAKMEVVVRGKGVALLARGHAVDLAEHLQRVVGASGVILRACQISMKEQKLQGSDLATFAQPVSSGVAEIVRKQEEGWSYVHAGP